MIFSVKDTEKICSVVSMGSKHFVLIYENLASSNIFGLFNYGNLATGTELTPSGSYTVSIFAVIIKDA